MIVIKKSTGEYPTPNDLNYINEIKHVRAYFRDRYGVTLGLKEAKDAIDNVMSLQYGLTATAMAETALRLLPIGFTTWDVDNAINEARAMLLRRASVSR